MPSTQNGNYSLSSRFSLNAELQFNNHYNLLENPIIMKKSIENCHTKIHIFFQTFYRHFRSVQKIKSALSHVGMRLSVEESVARFKPKIHNQKF